METETKPVGRKVSISEAREISKNNPEVKVIWRPEDNLPEINQYAMIFNE